MMLFEPLDEDSLRIHPFAENSFPWLTSLRFHPSVPAFLHLLIQFRVTVELEPLPAVRWRQAGSTPHRLSVHHWASA